MDALTVSPCKMSAGQFNSGFLASLTVSIFINPVIVPAMVLVPLTAAAGLVLPVKPVMMLPILTPLLALLLDVTLCLSCLDPPRICVPSLVDGLSECIGGESSKISVPA